MRTANSSIGKMEKHLMFQVVRMLKDKSSLSTRDMMAETRDGESPILTKLKDLRPRDFQKISDSTSTDHSTLSQDSQCTELLSAKVLPMSS
jgi:hypothetical protein